MVEKLLAKVSFNGLEDALGDVMHWVSLIVGLYVGLWLGLHNPDQFDKRAIDLSMKLGLYLYTILAVVDISLAAWGRWGRRAAD